MYLMMTVVKITVCTLTHKLGETMNKHEKLITVLLNQIEEITPIKNKHWFGMLWDDELEKLDQTTAVTFELDGIKGWRFSIWSNLVHIYGDKETQYYFIGEPDILIDKFRPSSTPFSHTDINLACDDLRDIIGNENWGSYHEIYDEFIEETYRLWYDRMTKLHHIPKYPKNARNRWSSRNAMLREGMPSDIDTIQADVIVSPFYWVFVEGGNKELYTNKQVDRYLDGCEDASTAEIGCMYINNERRYEYGRMWLKRFNGRWYCDKYMEDGY